MSFGMGKRLKYLKIRGQLLRTGEPEVDDPDVRVYRAVTLKDALTQSRAEAEGRPSRFSGGR